MATRKNITKCLCVTFAGAALLGCTPFYATVGFDEPIPQCGEGWAPVAERPGALTCQMGSLADTFPILGEATKKAREREKSPAPKPRR